MKTVAALVLATAAVASAQIDIKPLILGGTVVPAGTKTFQTGSRTTLTGRSGCGGSLIAPTFILTAAHCGSVSYVSVGSHYASGSADGERFAVKKTTIHPKYNEATSTYDYAILELAQPSTITPIKLLSADPETFAGETATVTGWGNTIEPKYWFQNGYPSEELLRVDVPVLSMAECKTKGLTGYPLSETMVCAGGVTNKDSCQGDSGGPLFLERPTGDVLIGVVSWGDGCGRANKPGVYSKVSYVKEWIQSIAPNATWV